MQRGNYSTNLNLNKIGQLQQCLGQELISWAAKKGSFLSFEMDTTKLPCRETVLLTTFEKK